MWTRHAAAGPASAAGRPGVAWRLLLAGLAALGALPGKADEAGLRLVQAAREQVGVTLHYDPTYQRLDYPGGDLPAARGVCTDVLVRAYRRLGLDLQVLVHEDMLAAWDAYPKLWGLVRPDANIDHRRVPNLAAYFARHGELLPASETAGDYAPGDLVTWRLPAGVPHIGIVSDRAAADGTPLVIHNIGRGAREENILFAYPITGHYRYLPAAQPSADG
jgi:uncharacterized protein YijF (DUF1287 family)